MKQIEINGKHYPCHMTMGALLRFKQETGHDIGQSKNDEGDMVTLLWCCIKSACAAQKIAFDYSLQEFADSCGIEMLNSFSADVAKDNTKKK